MISSTRLIDCSIRSASRLWGAEYQGDSGSGSTLASQRIIEPTFSCSAVVAANDLCAFDLLKVAKAAGCRVPEDLALVGFDDLPEAQATTPPLTTLQVARPAPRYTSPYPYSSGWIAATV